jgi:hypothetical protein
MLVHAYMHRLEGHHVNDDTLSGLRYEAEEIDVKYIPEICICAAVRLPDGRIFRGHRHGDCRDAIILRIGENNWHSSMMDDQGFITSRNRYVGRTEGRALQDLAGIPSADKGGYRGSLLFSEDLY